MIGISKPTTAIMLKCSMLDDLVNTKAQKINK